MALHVAPSLRHAKSPALLLGETDSSTDGVVPSAPCVVFGCEQEQVLLLPIILSESHTTSSASALGWNCCENNCYICYFTC